MDSRVPAENASPPVRESFVAHHQHDRAMIAGVVFAI